MTSGLRVISIVVLNLMSGLQYSAAQGITESNGTRQCSVHGRVTDMRSGAVVKKATIHIEPFDAEDDHASAVATYRFGSRPLGEVRDSAISDSSGSFCFENVEAGLYRLSGSKPGFLRTYYGAMSPAESGKIVRVEAEQSKALDLALVPQGVISGIVTDEDYEPVTRAGIKLLRRTWATGAFRNISVRGAQTNDLGEFRVWGVSPGTYYLLVEPNNRVNFGGDTESGAWRRVPLRTFAPGVATPAQAAAIDVRPGEEITGVNIRVLTGQVHSISGKVVGAVSPADNGAVIILPEGEEPMSLVVSNSGISAGGTFRFPGLSPGRYLLKYMTMSGESAKAGRQTVNVVDHGVNNIALNVVMPATIHGRIWFEGTAQKTAEELSHQDVQLMLVTSDAVVGPASKATIASDGTFVISNIAPGKYVVQSTGHPSGTYLKTIRFRQTDVTNRELDLTDGVSGEMEVVYRYGASNVSGKVDRPRGLGGNSPAYVVLRSRTIIPTAEGEGIMFAQTDGTGSFFFEDVRPDHYQAYAFESLDFSILRNSVAMKSLESVGTDLEVNDGNSKTVTLQLIPAEEMHRVLRTR